MPALNTTQRQYLRKLAHDLKPVVLIGKNGVTDTVITTIHEAIEVRELIKVKFLDFQDQKQTLAQELADRSNSQLVAIIGNIAILYRQQPDREKRTIELPR